MRDIRLAISDIAVLMTEDGTRYVIRDRHEEIEMIWPDGLVPLQALGPKKGFERNCTPRTTKATRRDCRIYGVAPDDGQPQELVRLRLGGKGPGFESISVVDLIAEARTVWLSD